MDQVVHPTFYKLTLLEGLQFSFIHGSSIMRRIIPGAFLITSLREVNRIATGQIPHD